MITAFIPCKKSSERVPNKNTKRFGHYSSGLIQLKVYQLLLVPEIDSIVVSTNDPSILDFIRSLSNPKVTGVKRASHLCSNQTHLEDLVCHACSLVEGDILWTHVTAPFLSPRSYSNMIQSYKENLIKGCDSLLTVLPVRTHLISNKGAINYDPSINKCPPTQTLPNIVQVTHGAFLASKEVMLEHSDRVGSNPFFYKLNQMQSLDIDWPSDFELCDSIELAGFLNSLEV